MKYMWMVICLYLDMHEYLRWLDIFLLALKFHSFQFFFKNIKSKFQP